MSSSFMSRHHYLQVKENKLELNNNDFSCKNNNVVMVNGYSETSVEVSDLPQLFTFFLRLVAC